MFLNLPNQNLNNEIYNLQYVLSYDVESSAEETYCINFKFFKINTIEPLPKSRGFFYIKILSNSEPQ